MNESLDLDQIELPRETLYMIDKVVWQRVTKGPFGADYSELLNEDDMRLSWMKNENIQRLVDGQSTVSWVIDIHA